MGVTAADAAPMTVEPEAVNSSGATKAGELLAVSSTALKAPADAKVTLASASVASATPKPKPVVRVEQVSRDGERISLDRGNLSASRANIMGVAARYVGTPYRYGGTTPSGFDCSGYVQYVFKQVGVSLPRTSSAQGSAGTRVSRSEAQPGDLVYKPGHIGIYAGDNMMYDSPHTGEVVQLREIYSSEFVFVRVLNS
jgi:cell wall-associated NlpC family hydrolase